MGAAEEREGGCFDCMLVFWLVFDCFVHCLVL